MNITTKLANWGNYPLIDSKISKPKDQEQTIEYAREENDFSVRGNGRSYGDASLNYKVLSTTGLNKIISFDEANGTIQCEAGTLLNDILTVIIPKGYFLPVTPGTKFITVGGAIAADVHGKNHHQDGSFGKYINHFQLLLPDHRVLTCSRTENAEIFWATCGGMGLTGIILKANLKLKPIESSYISQETVKAKNLGELMDLFEESVDWPYTVSWVDGTASGNAIGKALLIRGRHALKEDLIRRIHKENPYRLSSNKTRRLPKFLPSSVLNPLSIRLYNHFHYNCQTKTKINDYDRFFYPLDAIENWNQLYGKNGFLQYQVVIPKKQSQQVLSEILKRVNASKQVSYLTTIKLLGKANDLSPISFPLEGYTITLDLKMNQSVLDLLENLDQLVIANEGRVYLAKDARISADNFRRMYPRYEEFTRIIRNNSKLQSLQSKRIGLTR